MRLLLRVLQRNSKMIKLYLFFIAAVVMLIIIPLSPFLAVSTESPFYTHIIYMYAHANILHWSINTCSIFFLYRIISPLRFLAAWLASILISFIPSEKPVVGLSVIIFFFTGIIMSRLFRYYRNSKRYRCFPGEQKTMIIQTIIILIIGFFIPNMAASFHLAAFIAGCLYSLIERECQYLVSFFK